MDTLAELILERDKERGRRRSAKDYAFVVAPGIRPKLGLPMYPLFVDGSVAMNIKIWLKATRIPFFTATIIPVILGSIIGWHDSVNFRWLNFSLAMLGALLIHAGTNLANDYFDHLSGCDEANLTPTPFSGGSRVIQEGLVTPKQILIVSLATFSMGSLIGLYLNYICGRNVILILGIIGVFLGFFYSAKPFRIGYGSWGNCRRVLVLAH